MVLLKEIAAYTKRKGDLEKQCTELSAKIEQINGDLEKKSKELQDKNTKVEEAGNQLKFIQRDLKRISRKGKFAVIAILGVSAVIIIFGRFYYEERISELRYSYELAEERSEEALAKLSDLEEYAGLAMVKVNRVYNADMYNEKIGDLESSEMRFLCFALNVYFLENDVKKATIYMDIYMPDGSLMYSKSSPVGHTTSFAVTKSNGTKIGWGNDETSIYPAGTYYIEFVYQDEVIHVQKVVISQMDSVSNGSIKLIP